jgi:hypothetical protein
VLCTKRIKLVPTCFISWHSAWHWHPSEVTNQWKEQKRSL